jgi:hypothetical protein
MAVILNNSSSYLQTDLWTATSTKHCSGHLLAVLRRRMGTAILLCNYNLQTFSAAENLYQNSKMEIF